MAILHHNQSTNLIKYLIENKSKINEYDFPIQTPLHLSLQLSNLSFETIKLLVEKKSDLSLKNRAGFLPLHLACKNDQVNFEILKLLIESNSNIQDTVTGASPLELVCENKNVSLEIVQYFIEKNSNVNHVGLFEYSPLYKIYHNDFVNESSKYHFTFLFLCSGLNFASVPFPFWRFLDPVFKKYDQMTLWNYSSHRLFPIKCKIIFLILILIFLLIFVFS